MYSIICLVVKEVFHLLDEGNPMFFPVNWFIVYDKLGNGSTVDFPVRLESRLKWTPTVYDTLKQNSCS